MDTVIEIGDVLVIARQRRVSLAVAAERTGLTPEQIAGYEATTYRDAPLAHCQAVAEALGVLFHAEALVPRATEDEPVAATTAAPQSQSA